MPLAARQSSAEIKQVAWSRSIGQLVMLGSPQASPAIRVDISPPTLCGSPSLMVAERYRQFALCGSTMMMVGACCASFDEISHDATGKRPDPGL